MNPMQLRDLISNPLVVAALESAGYHTTDDVYSLDLDDVSDSGFLKSIHRSVDWLDLPGETKLIRAIYRFVIGPKFFDIPAPFKCGLSASWMEDAVITPEGRSYDRVHITRWIRCFAKDPVTQTPLTEDMLIPNTALNAAIALYRPLEENFQVFR